VTVNSIGESGQHFAFVRFY